MQRVFDFLKDEGPAPESGAPVWILGRSYPVEDGKWSEEFLNEVNNLVWLMYRTQFSTPIPRHADGPSPLLQNMNAFLRSGPYSVQASTLVDSFTSDVGWGCMIRTGQSLLANALLRLQASTDSGEATEVEILRKFCDDPSASYSIHRFVEYGAAKCGKLPGQWFGPSAVAACIAEFAEPPLSVYISSGADVFEQDLLALQFPILVLCGLRLGIQEVNPVYYPGLQSLLTCKQSVGIAGGRTSASHYFYGFQNTRLFFHDPHEPKPSLSPDSQDSEFVNTMHSRRLRALEFADMDPSMLAGFLLASKQDFEDWKEHFAKVPRENSVINITSEKPPTGFLEDLSDDDDDDDDEKEVEIEAGTEPRESNPVKEEVSEPRKQEHSDAKPHTSERIAQESIVTVDVYDPREESTIDLSRQSMESTAST